MPNPQTLDITLNPKKKIDAQKQNHPNPNPKPSHKRKPSRSPNPNSTSNPKHIVNLNLYPNLNAN